MLNKIQRNGLIIVAITIIVLCIAKYELSTLEVTPVKVQIPPPVQPIPDQELEIPEEPDIILEEVRQIHCIALAIYGEARGETAEGMEWVAWVVKNRATIRGITPCEVLLQPYQFEAFNLKSKLRPLVNGAIDGEITFPRMNNRWIQRKIHNIAEEVYYSTQDPTKIATHFWAPTLQTSLGRQAPKWSKRLRYIRTVGNHKFYSDSI